MTTEKITLRVHEGCIQGKYANLGVRPTPAAWHEYILMRDAKRLWEKAVQCMKEGESYVPVHRSYATTVHVGWSPSTTGQVLWRDVHRITPKGTLYIGCGKVSFIQMSKIAKELGWKD